MSRKVYRVVPSSGFWHVTHERLVLSRHALKSAAVAAGTNVARVNQPSQLVVHKADGTIEYEHTYGNDPYPPKG